MEMMYLKSAHAFLNQHFYHFVNGFSSEYVFRLLFHPRMHQWTFQLLNYLPFPWPFM